MARITVETKAKSADKDAQAQAQPYLDGAYDFCAFFLLSSVRTVYGRLTLLHQLHSMARLYRVSGRRW